MGKKSGSGFGSSGSGMNNPSHISESLDTIFLLKYLNSLMWMREPGSGIGKTRIRDEKNSDPGSWINIPDPQHFLSCSVLVMSLTYINPYSKDGTKCGARATPCAVHFLSLKSHFLTAVPTTSRGCESRGWNPSPSLPDPGRHQLSNPGRHQLSAPGRH